MARNAFAQAAITAFLEPGGFGDLFVWRISSDQLMQLCASKPKFDPCGTIETLILGGARAGDLGREALEDHFRAALAKPGSVECLSSGSAVSRRAGSLVGSTASAFDLELGFLDLLIHIPNPLEALPPPVLRAPESAMCQGFLSAWGVSLAYCGRVEEAQWNTYNERALAVLALIERSELAEASLAPNSSASRSTRL